MTQSCSLSESSILSASPDSDDDTLGIPALKGTPRGTPRGHRNASCVTVQDSQESDSEDDSRASKSSKRAGLTPIKKEKGRKEGIKKAAADSSSYGNKGNKQQVVKPEPSAARNIPRRNRHKTATVTETTTNQMPSTKGTLVPKVEKLPPFDTEQNSQDYTASGKKMSRDSPTNYRRNNCGKTRPKHLTLAVNPQPMSTQALYPYTAVGNHVRADGHSRRTPPVQTTQIGQPLFLNTALADSHR